MTDYGIDYDVLAGVNEAPALDTTFQELTDPGEVIKRDLYKLLTTPTGALWWAPTSTLDVREWLLKVSTPGNRAQLQRAIVQVCAADERLDPDRTVVEVVFSSLNAKLTISVTVYTATEWQPVSLVLDATSGAVTVQRAA